MSFSLILNKVITLYQNNLLVGLAVTLILIFFLFRKPIALLGITLTALILAGMLYLISAVAIWK